MVDRILIAIDGSGNSLNALSFAAEEWPDAELTLFHVINPSEAASSSEDQFAGMSEQWYETARARGQRVLEDAAEELDREIETRIEVGRPTRTIVEATEEGTFDLVVVGSRGRTGVSRMLLGSVAEGVVRRSAVPVTVVR